MARALVWLGAGLVVFVLAATLLAPPELVLRAVGLTAVAAVPAGLLAVLVRDQHRRTAARRGRQTDVDGET